MQIRPAAGFVLLLALLAPVFGLEARAQSFLGEWTATAETLGGGVSEQITAVKTEKGYAITVKLGEALHGHRGSRWVCTGPVQRRAHQALRPRE